MRRYTRSCQLAVLGMALASCSHGQSHQAPAPTPIAADEHKVSELPTGQLNITASDPVSGLKASQVIILPTQCTSDGVLFLDMLQPPSFMQQALYAVTPKSSLGFEISAINDLHGADLISFFPGSEHVAVLVHATRETSPLSGEAKIRQSSYGYFVALFDRRGRSKIGQTGSA